MTNTADDFLRRVDRNGPVPAHRPELGPCHVWTACRLSDGYGRVRFEGTVKLAHRVAFYLAHGRWPELCTLHHCDNRACVNPEHLFEGTIAENNADRDAKSRTSRGRKHGASVASESRARGERSGRAKLTDQQVLDIRANAALCRVSSRELARRYGVSHTHISMIVRGQTRACRDQ